MLSLNGALGATAATNITVYSTSGERQRENPFLSLYGGKKNTERNSNLDLVQLALPVHLLSLAFPTTQATELPCWQSLQNPHQSLAQG